MTPSYTILDATPAHVRALIPTLRAGDVAEIRAGGLTPFRCVRQSYRLSYICRTALIGDDVAAMWGVGGSLLGNEGAIWLLTGEAIERLPWSFALVARREVRSYLDIYPVLSNHVLASYAKAVGFLKALGFTVEEPQPLGRHGEMFSLFWMRRN